MEDTQAIALMNAIRDLAEALSEHSQAMRAHIAALQPGDWLGPEEAADLLGIRTKGTYHRRRLKEMADRGLIVRQDGRPPKYSRQSLLEVLDKT